MKFTLTDGTTIDMTAAEFKEIVAADGAEHVSAQSEYELARIAEKIVRDKVGQPDATPDEARAEIVRMAWRDLHEGGIPATEKGKYGLAEGSTVKAEFEVNRRMRIVTANLIGHLTGKEYGQATYLFDDDECFNVHVGKAIALRLALGLDVPAAYYDLPQPLVPQAGDVTGYPLDPHDDYTMTVRKMDDNGIVHYVGGGIDSLDDFFERDFNPDTDLRIIDDSARVNAFEEGADCEC